MEKIAILFFDHLATPKHVIKVLIISYVPPKRYQKNLQLAPGDKKCLQKEKNGGSKQTLRVCLHIRFCRCETSTESVSKIRTITADCVSVAADFALHLDGD